MIQRTSMALAAAALAALAGCGSPSELSPQVQATQNEYRRLAIVCGPAIGADPKYAAVVLDQAKAEAGRILGPYLTTVDCLPDVAVEAKSIPPRVELGAKAADYDGVCCLVYSHKDGRVILFLYVLNVKTGKCVWTHKMETADPDIHRRLSHHGAYVPSTLKRRFYCFR